MNVLLIIDLQLGSEHDSPRLDLDGVIDRINRLAQVTRESNGQVIFIQHNGPPGHRLEPHTPGWSLLPGLVQDPTDIIVQKRASDAFYETELDQLLKQFGVDQLLVTGCASEMCVDTTIRAATSRGYQVVVASDGHTTREKPHLDAATIITHHNWVWEHLIVPERKIKVLSSEQISEQLNVTV